MESVKNLKILRGVYPAMIDKKNIPILLFAAILVLWMVNGYLFVSSTFIIGLMMLPYLTIIKNVDKKGGFYAFFTILSLIASLYLPSRTLHFFTLAFGALALIEMQYGRLSLLPLFAVVLTSSLVTNFSLVFSFPIRLKISDLAAKTLSFFDPTATAEGNIIHFKGTDFSVDTACMGLTMLQMSLLLALFLMAYFEREKHLNFTPRSPDFIGMSFLHIFTILMIALGLNVFFNLLRIILLVLFGWMPETFMHDAAGLVGLGLYVFLPLYFIVKNWFWILDKMRRVSIARNKPMRFLKPHRFVSSLTFPKVSNFWKVNLNYIFSFTILAFLSYVSLYDTHDKRPLNTPTLLTIKYLEDTHCPKSQAKDGILKYENGEILVYLKPIPGFYAAEHSPMICWQGSGYVFGQVKSTYIGGMELYSGVLKKGNETLQTAWWYDNGTTRTASQTVWRAAILHGEPNFNLVNITAGDSVSLRHNIERILATN